MLATFVGGQMDGLPALMKKSCGKGTGYYQAAMSAELARKMTVEVAKAAGIEASGNPCEDVSICPDLLGRGT